MLVVGDDAALRVGHRVGQAAFLAAAAAVGAAAGVGMADETLAAVGHAQGAVHEELQRGPLYLLADGNDLLQVQLAGQHHLREADVLQKARLLGRADVGLGAGVQLHGRQVQLQQAHVLHDQGIDTGVVQLPGLPAGALQLVVTQDGVHRDEDARIEAVGMLHQPRDVFDGVGRLVARAEARAADVDGVGAMVDGLDADVGIAGGGEQFEAGQRCGSHAGF